MLNFEKYVGTNQRGVVKIVSRSSVLNPKDLTMITDSMRWYDSDNEKYIQREAIDMIQELHSRMSRKKTPIN